MSNVGNMERDGMKRGSAMNLQGTTEVSLSLLEYEPPPHTRSSYVTAQV